MDTDAIISELRENHTAFFNFIKDLEDEDFVFSPPGKWTAGQQLEHIFLSVKPLNSALRLPAFFLKFNFGKANRPSKSYEELVEKYKVKLGGGGPAGNSRFFPAPVDLSRKALLLEKTAREIETLTRKIRKFSESALDELILPHPLLGKITLREMMFFTIYHVQHHHHFTKQNLDLKKI